MINSVDVMLLIIIIVTIFLFFLWRGKQRFCFVCWSGRDCQRRIEAEKKIKKGLRVLFIFSLCFFTSNASFAGLPLITDDTDTQGRGNTQVEVSLALWQHKNDIDGPSTEKSKGGELATTFTFGVQDKIDVAFAVPYQWWKSKIEGLRVEQAKGIGDSCIDLKWGFFNFAGWSAAVKPGISFPTGNEERNLGKGRATYRVCFIISKELLPLTFHINAGYKRNENHSNERKDLWHASLASEWEISRKFKLMMDTGISRNESQDSRIYPTFALLGFSFSLLERLTLTVGVKFGLNKEEMNLTSLLGLVHRF